MLMASAWVPQAMAGWYMGNAGESCTTVCNGIGTCNEQAPADVQTECTGAEMLTLFESTASVRKGMRWNEQCLRWQCARRQTGCRR
mmetsp:Transcript_9062/g.19411  ORF Transcript_9062/g.19411 Transcript_9062/m.19411 type:complete len:86 (+) Transcript_9062:74-331(+)